MSFESSSPRRFESTARMVGVIPLYACIHVLCVCRYVDVTVSAPNPGPRLRYRHDVPGDDNDGDVVRLAVLVEVFEAGVKFDVWRGGEIQW